MIDLCVVNYKTPQLLSRLLETLLLSDGNCDFRLYVADNGSEDNSVIILEDWSKRYDIEIVQNKNIGFSAACNNLASRGNGDIIALLNADVWFTNSHLAQVQAAFDCDPTVSSLGPKQRDEMGRVRHAGIFGTNEQPRHRGWGDEDKEDIKYRDQVEAVTISGSAYFVRRSVWEDLTHCPVYQDLFPEALGAFLPTPHYYEETFCSYHARHHGYKVVYDGTISIGHSWHASSSVGEAEKYLDISRNLFRQACDKHGIARD